MDPAAVLGRLRSLGGELPVTYVVGCVPADVTEGIGLSAPVAAAVPEAIAVVGSLWNNTSPSPPKAVPSMCLGIPGQVIELVEGYGGQLALVDVAGVPRKINIGLLDDGPPEPGSWVLIHMGFALERVDAAGAEQAMGGLELMGRAREPEGGAAPGVPLTTSHNNHSEESRMPPTDQPRPDEPTTGTAPGTARAFGSEPPLKEPAHPGRDETPEDAAQAPDRMSARAPHGAARTSSSRKAQSPDARTPEPMPGLLNAPRVNRRPAMPPASSRRTGHPRIRTPRLRNRRSACRISVQARLPRPVFNAAVGNLEVPRRKVLQLLQLLRCEAVAHPVPVEGYDVAHGQVRHETRSVDGVLGRFRHGLADLQRRAVPHQRPGKHHGLVAGDRQHLAPPDPAPVQHVQRRGVPAFVAEQAQPRIDLEDMETVVRDPARQHSLHQMRELPAGAGPEPVLHGVADVGDAHGVQQAVPHPVRLDHPGIKRIGDAVRAGDEFQIGPCSGKAPGQLAESLIGDAGLAVVEQGVAVRRPAAAARIRRIGIADKQLGTIDNHHVATFCKRPLKVAPGCVSDKGGTAG